MVSCEQPSLHVFDTNGVKNPQFGLQQLPVAAARLRHVLLQDGQDVRVPPVLQELSSPVSSCPPL